MHVQIRIRGHLGAIWQPEIEDLHITHQPDGTSLLSGQLADQAALYGVLLTIRRLGLTLLFLEIEDEKEST
ncbi:hypothetical protein EI42_02393 [Thermosporothrix hazakensis]|jgi:hypothetical protein|uniref:Uncharacterized protein n=2 Tax=Thermosporothrix TaxID=768650 RepID=A0A326U9K9_THEHA|nr:hypothetical protein [Thermosporothrix hazakensis]PZW31296.1 hypothetical protein EI42_02393 [Thermosporothrix hazakensis]BBH86471.1 hypothetical protein KTC_12220 [Thermosporothrix sp. COM3]GCE50792.1 hypothetical protein KTH_56610 [Thermosporothrix hazakensis]